MDWLSTLTVSAAIAITLAAAWATHRLLLAANRRGWIVYPRGRGRITAIYDPSLDHAIEETLGGDLRHVDDQIGQGHPGGDTNEDPG